MTSSSASATDEDEDESYNNCSYNGDSDLDDGNSLVLNPLLIPHVAKQILYYCSFPTLKSSRLVCRLWKDIGTKMFNSQSKIRFYNFQHIDAFMSSSQDQDVNLSISPLDLDIDHDDDKHHHHLTNGLNLNPNPPLPSRLPLPWDVDVNLCRNVCLHGADFQEWVILLKPFFSKFGSHIKSLDISHGIGDVTEDFMLQIAQHIESLEELSISGTTVMYSDRYIDGGGGSGSGFQFYPILPSVKKLNLKLPVTCFKRWSDVRTFFTDFFSLFPNVESIKFVGCQFPELFKYLPQEIRFPRLSSVHLQLLNSEGLHHFIGRNFPLSRMTLDIEPLVGLNNLHVFLEAFAHTLTHLDLRFHFKGEYNYSHNATGFPSSQVLKRLKFLRLYGYWGHLYFLQDFKSLERATVEKMKWEVAFPNGTEKIKWCRNRILFKFFDEEGVYQEL